MSQQDNHNRRHSAAHATFQDMLGELRLESPDQPDQTSVGSNDALDGFTFATLLEQNFDKLDPTGKGITREELAQALLSPGMFTPDEYVMLHLLGKYFDTIANMCEDEVGNQTVITNLDKDVLNQFLYHSQLSLSDLHRWRAIQSGTPT